LISDTSRLLVIGSEAANVSDRTLGRDNIVSVQSLDSAGNFTPHPAFNAVGANGVAAMYYDAQRTRLYYSGGTDLHYIDFATGAKVRLPVKGLVDAHEMEVWDGLLWLTSTGTDEYITYDPETGAFDRRHIVEVAQGAPRDKHHLNHIARGADGELYGLVHHIDGKQILNQIKARALKSQGNGGVIRLSDGKRFPLRLHAPHTVTAVGDENWVFDSGQASIRIFSADWTPLRAIPTSGWGRGGALYEHGRRRYFAAGLSNIRQRYQHLFKNYAAFINGVQIFDAETGKQIFCKKIEGVEQINNVYVLPAEYVAML